MERASPGVCPAWGDSTLRALSRGRPAEGLIPRAVSGVQGEEPHRPRMRALPGPGGG
jgi:hypothetical protein